MVAPTSKSIIRKFIKHVTSFSFILEFSFIVLCMFFMAGVCYKYFFSFPLTLPSKTSLWVEETTDAGITRKIGNVNVLVLGLDSEEEVYRSDTIIVFALDPSHSKITMLSIPRDTRVTISGKIYKINEIAPRFGVEVLISLLEDLLELSIDRYIKVDYQGFVKFIDALGGVTVNIERHMRYDDNFAGLHINFSPGKQHLDGKDALKYVRYRGGPTADLGRIKRQQEFIKTIILKVMTPSSFASIPKIIDEVFSHFKTDFSLSEFLVLVKAFPCDIPEVISVSLPGEARYIDKVSYFVPYLDKIPELGEEFYYDAPLVEVVATFSAEIEE